MNFPRNSMRRFTLSFSSTYFSVSAFPTPHPTGSSFFDVCPELFNNVVFNHAS
jgi:hypothetical protein